MTTKSKSRKPRSPKPAEPNDIEEAYADALTSCTSSAARLTVSLWTTGSKRNARFSERKNNGRSKLRQGLILDGDQVRDAADHLATMFDRETVNGTDKVFDWLHVSWRPTEGDPLFLLSASCELSTLVADPNSLINVITHLP